jgi:hypothetical protein
MTDEELIAQARNRPHDAPMPTEHLMDTLADRIEALTAEVERLREGLNAIIDRGVERDQKWMGMNARDIARTALEKQP